ncbi:hypothetical protein [Lewinella sp. W8]|uniref:hypothetical protein n=1 Tax=Lewinella sp. W8 TaxID=2528208 RepID=UPI001067E9BA|nr:hypothetical protein [Lewinella sp. W8]MTB49657.1 hypothetical protein [Lewinella sp. W8]
MRKIFSLLFLVLAFFLGFLLYKSIEEPINFSAERVKRDRAVAEQLGKIRTTQELYRDITGEFAPDFDTLRQVLETGDLLEIAVVGDPDDPDFTGEITYDTTRLPAIDSIRAMGIDLATLDEVPYGEGAKFDITANVIDYQSTSVPVVQVGVQKKKYMGRFADARFSRYDQNYDPNSAMKFGDLTKPSLAGTWQ